MKESPLRQNRATTLPLAAAILAAVLWQPLANHADIPASTFTYSTQFDATFDPTLTGPFVGSGSLSYDAPSALPDGVYDWTSFTNLDLLLDFGFVSFTEANLTTTAAAVNIHLVGANFFFSNDSGAGDGISGGSADFLAGGYVLTTEPYLNGPLYGGGLLSPLYYLNPYSEQPALQVDQVVESFSGTYGVATDVPEASTYAAGAAALLTLGSVCWRARRRRS